MGAGAGSTKNQRDSSSASHQRDSSSASRPFTAGAAQREGEQQRQARPGPSVGSSDQFRPAPGYEVSKVEVGGGGPSPAF